MTWLYIVFWVWLGLLVGFVLGAFVVSASALRREEEIVERLRWMQREGAVVRISEGNGDRSA